jgi:energy-coupling factor transport system permease protein
MINPFGRRSPSPRRGGLGSVLLRRLPHDSSVHRLSIVTKLIALLALTIATGLNTSWWQLLAVAGIVALSLVAARVPWRARPRLPTWFWGTLAIGFAFSVSGGGGERFLRLLGFTLLFMLLSLVIAWTTDLAELAPTLRSLSAPLRRLGLPVDTWAVTTALAVRCLPLMLDECRVVVAARSQRSVMRDPAAIAAAVVDVITASMAATVRRAADLGEVISMRGGPTLPSGAPIRLHARDLAALVCISLASVLPSVIT